MSSSGRCLLTPWWVGWVFCLLCLVLLVPSVADAQPERAKELELDALVLELRLDGQLLSDSLTAYVQGSRVLLPLGELARLLTLGITVRPDLGQASGFVLTEDQGFGLHVANAMVNMDGKDRGYERRLVHLGDDDIYVADLLLSQWLPLDLKLELSTLRLQVKPRVVLPLQARLARQAQAAMLIQSDQPELVRDFARHETPPTLFDIPFVDLVLGADAQATAKSSAARASSRLSFSGDLLGMEGQVFLVGSTDSGLQEHRLLLSRRDPDAGLLGPLAARALSLGNILLPGVAQVTRGSAKGVGALVSNRPLDQPTTFDRQTLSGPLDAGWDVTLYYNDVLVGYQSDRPDGQYLFEDLPLGFGNNEFRLVFNGPLGQSRVERKSYLLDQATLRPGEGHYTVGLQHSGDVRRQLAQWELGVTPWLMAHASLVSKTVASDARSSASDTERSATHVALGLRTYLSRVIANTQWIHDGQGASLGSLSLKSQIQRLTLDYSYTERTPKFESELFAQGPAGLRRRHALSMATLIKLPTGAALSTGLDLLRDQSVGLGAVRDMALRLGTIYKGTAMSGRLHATSAPGANVTEGMLQVARRVVGLGLVGQISYRMGPQAGVQGVSLSADHHLQQGARLNMGLNRDMASGITAVSAGFNTLAGEAMLGLSIGLNSRREATLSLQLFTSLGRNPRSQRWFRQAQPLAGTGAISARTFVDRNRNGALDAGEELVPNAAFVINGGGRHSHRSNSDGLAWLGALPAGRYVDVAVDPSSLEDPQWKPATPGLRVLTRSGSVDLIDFPLLPTSEVEGSICLQGRKTCRGVGEAQVQLLNSEGRVVAATRSANDGYYLLHQVEPGRYRLRIAPEQVAELGLGGVLERAIEVPQDSDFLTGQDLVLEPRE